MEINKKQSFYTNLKEEREYLGIPQEQLASELSVNIRTIRRIENMENAPNVILAMRIATYFNKKVDDMFWI